MSFLRAIFLLTLLFGGLGLADCERTETAAEALNTQARLDDLLEWPSDVWARPATSGMGSQVIEAASVGGKNRRAVLPGSAMNPFGLFLAPFAAPQHFFWSGPTDNIQPQAPERRTDCGELWWARQALGNRAGPQFCII